MDNALKRILKHNLLNNWNLFWLISVPITALVVYEMLTTDLTTGPGVSHMIGYAVRFAIPIIFIIVATSSLLTLFPNDFTRWLMSNRKFIGMSFAVAMFWQGVFIAVISIVHRDYYFENIFLFRDELEGTIGYILMAAMVLTSFMLVRKKLTKNQWDLVQKSGMYFLWAYPFSTYWWTTTYGAEYYDTHDFVFYYMGLFAMICRMAAWRARNSKKITHPAAIAVPTKLLAYGIILISLIAAMTPMYWQQPVSNFFYSAAWSYELVLWLPFYPFEPFMPLMGILLGVYLLTPKPANSTPTNS